MEWDFFKIQALGCWRNYLSSILHFLLLNFAMHILATVEYRGEDGNPFTFEGRFTKTECTDDFSLEHTV